MRPRLTPQQVERLFWAFVYYGMFGHVHVLGWAWTLCERVARKLGFDTT